MISHPDDALRQLRQIDPDDLYRNTVKAKYSLLLSEALDKNYVDIADDSIIKNAVVYYGGNGNFTERAKCFYYLGVVYQNANRLDSATRAYMRAIEYAEKSDNKNILGLTNNALGILLYSQMSYEEALTHFTNAYEAFDSAMNVRNAMYARESVAYTLQSLHLPEKSEHAYKEALRLAELQEDTLQILDLYGSLASLYLEQDELKKTEEILYRSFRKLKKEFTYKEYPQLLEIYLNKENIDSTLFYAGLVLKNRDRYSGYQLVGLYQLLSRVEQSVANYEKALFYQQKATIVSDSLKLLERNAQIMQLKRKYKVEQLEASYVQTRKYNTLLTLLSAVIIMFLGIVGWVVYLKRKEKLRQKDTEISSYIQIIDSIREENSTIEQKYNEMVQYLERSHQEKLSKIGEEKIKNTIEIDYYNKKTNLNRSMHLRLKSLKEILDIVYTYDNDTTYQKNIGNLMLKFKQQNQISNLTADLVDIFNLCDDGLCNHLRLKFQLDENEIFICCFILLGFKTNHISVITGVDPGSLNNKRSNIVNKLGRKNQGVRLEEILREEQRKLREGAG